MLDMKTVKYLGATLAFVKKSDAAFECFRCRDMFPSGVPYWKPVIESDRVKQGRRVCEPCGKFLGATGA